MFSNGKESRGENFISKIKTGVSDVLSFVNKNKGIINTVGNVVSTFAPEVGEVIKGATNIASNMDIENPIKGIGNITKSMAKDFINPMGSVISDYKEAADELTNYLVKPNKMIDENIGLPRASGYSNLEDDVYSGTKEKIASVIMNKKKMKKEDYLI